MRTVEWVDGKVRLIDQQRLPWELRFVEIETHQQMSDAIKCMTVRGAPAIGAAAGYGIALAAQSFNGTLSTFESYLDNAASSLLDSRPTAINLKWAVTKVIEAAKIGAAISVEEARTASLKEANAIADEDISINKRMGEFGAALIKDGDTVLHHCNTGSLATVDWGTALGVIRTAHYQGKRIHILLDETRPRLQGAHLSAWELKQEGIPFDVIPDNAAGYYMQRGEINIAFVGSDRTARNGDVANKIGTYQVAVLAKENGIPFFPVVPTSTIDLSVMTGEGIPIEQRSPEEVRIVGGVRIIPEDYPVRNPAFDITPHKYITGIVTENGIAYPPYTISLSNMVNPTQSKE